MTTVAQLDYAVNALGYSSALGRLVALTTRTRHDWPHAPHVVLFDRQGVATDMGAIRAHWHKFDDVSAGAVVGSLFYLRDNGKLHAVDIDPASPGYLTIVRSVRLDPDWLGHSVDDFTVNPVDGKLYGVSSAGHGPGKIVTIDPASGAVAKVAEPKGLPGGSAYGSIVIDSAGTLYATNNGYVHRSRFYRVALDGRYEPAEVATDLSLAMIDGAGCLPAPMPPKTPVPIPPPQPAPPPPPAPPAVQPVAPVVPPPPPPVVTPPPPASSVARQAPAPPRPSARRPEPREQTDLAVEPTAMTKPRKWAIATIVLVLFGAAGAASRARR